MTGLPLALSAAIFPIVALWWLRCSEAEYKEMLHSGSIHKLVSDVSVQVSTGSHVTTLGALAILDGLVT